MNEETRPKDKIRQNTAKQFEKNAEKSVIINEKYFRRNCFLSYIREVVSHIPFFYLEIIPFCAILLFAVLSLAVRKKKYVLFLLAFTGSFSCALICLHRNGGVPEALTHAFLFTSATLVLSPVFLLRREKKIAQR